MRGEKSIKRKYQPAKMSEFARHNRTSIVKAPNRAMLILNFGRKLQVGPMVATPICRSQAAAGRDETTILNTIRPWRIPAELWI